MQYSRALTKSRCALSMRSPPVIHMNNKQKKCLHRILITQAQASSEMLMLLPSDSVHPAGAPQFTERPLPFLSFAQSYSTLLPGLSGGQLDCGWRRTWELHPSEDLSELHRLLASVAMQKYHCRQMGSWRDGLPKPLWDERVSLCTLCLETSLTRSVPVQVVMARSPHRCPLSWGGPSAEVIQLPDMAGVVPLFSRFIKAVFFGLSKL